MAFQTYTGDSIPVKFTGFEYADGTEMGVGDWTLSVVIKDPSLTNVVQSATITVGQLPLTVVLPPITVAGVYTIGARVYLPANQDISYTVMPPAQLNVVQGVA